MTEPRQGPGAGRRQLHCPGRRRPEQLPYGPIVVVGGGGPGCRIAEEPVRSGEAHLAIGARQTPLPQRPLGRDVSSHLGRLGLMAAGRRHERPTVADDRWGRRPARR